MSPEYVLGSHPDEMARLDEQSAAIEQPTRLLLQATGIGPEMHVLDLGSGLGHVAQLVASLVGPEGSVVGVEQSPMQASPTSASCRVMFGRSTPGAGSTPWSGA
jgi:cyclopropane fatty-acyl-phospholipid synthase-like methyltransferase